MKAKALKCEMTKKSSTNENYNRYEIEYTDKDGFKKIVPAYGRDMQEALRRVSKELNRERYSRAYKKHISILLVLAAITAISTLSLILIQL